MSALVLAIHIIVCVVLIIAVLLQSGKAADLAGAFGGIGSQSVFGPRGAATLLTKVTTVCAVLFMVTSLGLWIMSAKGERSVMGGEEAPVEQKAATTPTSPEPQEKAQSTAAEEKQAAETDKKATETKAQEKKDAEKKAPEKKEDNQDQNKAAGQRENLGL